jgi:NAD(P)-dependent dehydrogenase (short-subunit alcohol dehydrogenase family)
VKDYSDLKDKVVLITGGTQGIGEAMADAFSAENSRVIINGRVMNDKVQRVLDRTGADASMGSLSDTEAAKKVVRDAEKKYGKIDVLICNAAGMSMSPFLERQEDEWWDQIHINLTGHIACIQEALPGMKKNGGGTIIITSSFFGTLGWNNATGYGASKSGLLALGQYISRQYRDDNIRACVIVPGVIRTPQLNIDAEDLGISYDEVCDYTLKILL